MSRFFLCAAALLALGVTTADAGVLIDNFNFTDQLLTTDAIGPAPGSPDTALLNALESDVATERTLSLEKTAGPVGQFVTVEVDATNTGLKFYSEESLAAGNYKLIYDELADMDLVGTGASMFRFDASVDLAVSLFFEVLSGGITYTADILIPADLTPGTLETYTLAFASFSGAPPLSVFQNVDSLTIKSNDTALANDIAFDNLSTVTPEPGTMALLALGGIGLAGARLRRRKAA